MNKISDKVPPLGVPLIVTVKDHLQFKPNELRYPVFYEKSKGGYGYRWSWRYGDFDYDLLPDVSEVVAWTEFPNPYEEDDCKEESPFTNADRIRNMSDEELAKNMMCPNENGLGDIDCDKHDDCKCYDCLLEWLQSESDVR